MHCLEGQAVNGLLLKHSAILGNRYGKKLFGKNFSLTNRIRYTAGDNGGFSGALDAVIPLHSWTDGNDGASTGALFLQQGITKYKDATGISRHDMRFGLVRRFSLSGNPGGDVVGLSALLQNNMEYGHGRLVTSLDYNGTWGRGAFHYFTPTTGWQNSLHRHNRQERPLEGAELRLNLSPTDTLDLTAALTRWEQVDNTALWATGARLGLRWRPHDWISLGTTWENSGIGRDGHAAHLSVSIPIGGTGRAPRWKGLGKIGRRARRTSTSDIWRPIENVGRIEVAERTISNGLLVNSDGTVKGATVRFMQDRANSGDTIKVQITLASAIQQDALLSLRLAPGSGDNPAIPGEDFLDKPTSITIPAGETTGTATIQLIRNAAMTKPRSLSVKVFATTAD